MATRIGIELSPVACRIVEIDAGPTRRRAAPDTRVRSFAALPPAGPAIGSKLASLRGRRAAVVAWGVRSEHRQVVVPDGPYERMREEAIASLREVGVDTRNALADIAPAAPRAAGATRRTVVVAIAAAADVASVLQPLTEAGIRVRSVVTPAVALMSIARSRSALSAPQALEAYVALEETATCVSLVRDGVLIGARDLGWGYLDAPSRPFVPRRREDVAAQLSDELAALFVTVRPVSGPVAQVNVCGGMPELRSMTVPLMERLDLEVETLDSLFAIDVARLPEPADEFRDRSAELRLAWAVAADWRAPINLSREHDRRAARAALSRAAVIAGVAAGVGVGGAVERSHWWQATASSKPVTLAAGPGSRPPVAKQTGPTRKPAPAAPVRVDAPSQRTFAPAKTSRGVRLQADQGRLKPAATGLDTGSRLSPRVEAPRARETDVARERQRWSPVPPPLPFDAVLGTILYAPERKLAIVDGRIVEPGDDIRGARVVDITPATVVLRDAQGRLRRLTLGAFGR